MLFTEKAYGKLNLALDVLGKRPDGYHDMRMIMQSVDFYDTVTVQTETGTGWQFDCYREKDARRDVFPQNEKNLAWRAAEIFCRAAGVKMDNLSVTICKRIPTQAGMAGGSSDAAAVLRALNRACGAPFSVTALCNLAEQVGSDVPYCVLGGTALAEGRGEILTALTPLPEVYFVVCMPDFAVSTPELFAAIDQSRVASHPDIDAMLQAIAQGNVAEIGNRMGNVFQILVERDHPVVSCICRMLLACGACGAQMTGTGSVVFGMFSDLEDAKAAREAVQAYASEIFLAKPV